MEEEIFKIGGWPGRFRVTHLRLVVTDAHTNWGFGKEIMFCDSVFHKIKCMSVISIILNQKEWIVSVDRGRAGLGCGEG